MWWQQPAQMHCAIMRLQPPPDHHGGSDLARAHHSSPALPGAVHADAQIEVTGRWPGYVPGLGQRPQASG
jgi:hypothetical protein